MVSPRYDLSNISLLDYHRVLEDLHRRCKIILAGNIASKPSYADALMPLEAQRFSMFIHNRLSIALSNSISFSGYIRKGLETAHEKYIFKNLATFFKKHKPDILYFFPRYPDSYHLKLSDGLSPKIVVEFWEDQIEHLYEDMNTSRVSRKYSELERARGNKWVEHTLQKSDRILVPTTVLKQRLVSLGGSADKISVVPVCQDPIVPRDPSYARRKHGFRTEKILLYLGSLVTYHDLTTILLALNRVKSSEVVLLIAGGRETIVNKYRNLVRNNRVKIVYVGRPSAFELEYYLSAASICLGIYKFVEPSGFFPGSVIKYMLARKAIIATDLPEIREMFHGLKAGLLVQQTDANELALAIDFLLDNYVERVKMGTIAQKIAENHYLWKHHTNALVKTFESLIS